MKRNSFPKPALYLLISGLLITAGTPLLNRFYPLPDALRGFLTGLGLALEIVALIKAQRNKQNLACKS